jgi:hypothetical protein
MTDLSIVDSQDHLDICKLAAEKPNEIGGWQPLYAILLTDLIYSPSAPRQSVRRGIAYQLGVAAEKRACIVAADRTSGDDYCNIADSCLSLKVTQGDFGRSHWMFDGEFKSMIPLPFGGMMLASYVV